MALALGGVAEPVEVIVSKGASLVGRTVYVDVGGVATRGVVRGVGDEALTVEVLGNEIALPYERFSERRLFRLAKRAAGKEDAGLLVGLFRYASARPALAEEAEKLEAFIRESFPGKLTPAEKPRPKPVVLPERREVSRPPPAAKKGPHGTPGPCLTGSRGSFRGIHRAHPKIFVRDAPQAAPCGITLAELRRRCSAAPWSGYAGRLREHRQYGSFYCIPNLAMRWLVRGDGAAADRVIELLTKKHPRDATTTEGDLIEAASIGYDWVYNYPGFSDEEKGLARKKLLESARRLRRMMYNHVWHTRPYAWTNGVLFAGLALHPEEPEGEKLAVEAIKHYREDFFPARALHDGMWQNGMAYGRKYMTRSVFHALSAWSSATGEDIWWEVASRGENWAERMLYGFIYACRPDYTYVTYGDFFASFWTARTGSFDNLLDSTRGTRNPFGKGFLVELQKKYGAGALEPHRAYYFPLFWDPAVPAQPKAALPECELFSQHGMGCAFFRSGWGPDDLFAFFKCGDYYGDHGHFDQGTFEIFYKRPLAVDSGSYTEGFRGPHRMRYTRRAVAHNALVFPERGKPDDEGGQRIIQAQSTVHPRSHPKKCDTGDILAFDDAPAYARVHVDVARAYDGVRVFFRHFVYVKPNVIVVFDAVSLPARKRRVFLYHYPTSAELGQGFFRVRNGGGELVARVLLPPDAEIRDLPGFKVGRKDYAPRNPGSADIVGKGRVEIEPRDAGSETTHFLVVMTIGGPGVRPVASSFKEVPGAFAVELAGQRLIFGKDGRSFRRE